ncbi:hypothetical protein GW796_05800 [archaeon]|nr:hypothetical protein [archaeon]NCQ51398.1 hypothetical protein [archaeon]NCT58776.1 hypothetical protein [archaeon]
MAIYIYKCDKCGVTKEIKMSFEEHSKKKNQITCECDYLMYQVVTAPMVKFLGSGWFFNTGYEVTQNEMNKNLDSEKKIEERYNNARAKNITL